jgi:hypothetical protein
MSVPSIVYIYCPAKVVTGGTELLHQLASSLTQNGLAAYMVYYENDQIVDSDTPNSFIIYQTISCNTVKDLAEAWVVLPEVYLHIGKQYQQAKVVCWWLSVDNFFHDGLGSTMDAIRWNTWFGLKRIIKQYVLGKPYPKRISLKSLRSEKYLHLYQSYYAQSFLKSHGISQVKELGDYINLSYLHQKAFQSKEDIVLYNPKKVSTRFIRIMKSSPNIKWVPLQNMNLSELITMYGRAKLYVDFGTHPGKDRIPREAIIHNCCLLTNKKGSAGYFEDVPISDEYKISDSKLNATYLQARISYIFKNYTTEVQNFESYRKLINREKAQFDQQIHSIFLS